MIRLSDTKLDHLMDVAEMELDKSLAGYQGTEATTHAVRSIAASNLVIAELTMRYKA